MIKDDYLERRLEHWAEWCLKQSDHGLGYPKRSLEARMQEGYGFFEKTYKRNGHIPVNPAAEEVESSISELAQYQATLAKVLRLEYTQKGTQASKAHIMQTSVSHFKHLLNLAKAWLAGRLTISDNKRFCP